MIKRNPVFHVLVSFAHIILHMKVFYHAISKGDKKMKRSDLRLKDVININSGKKLGYIEDIEIDPDEGKIRAFIVPSSENFLVRLFSKNKDITVNWEDIDLIGEDVILVNLKDLK